MRDERAAPSTTAAPAASLTTAPAVPSSSAASADTSAASSFTGGGQQDEAAVKAAWIEFFDGNTPANRKVALLQNGSTFAQYLAAESTSPLAKHASATVASVGITSAGQATAHYAISLAGKEALPDQIGTAIRIGGAWKVGQEGFCALLKLQEQTPPPCVAGTSSPSA
jgi:hypothetical protein